MVRTICIVWLLVSTFIGCASEDDRPDPLNDLWRQGYGFNNPNYDRKVNGLPPVDFDRDR